MIKSKEIIRQKLTKSKEIIGILAYNLFFPGIKAGGKKKRSAPADLFLYIPVFLHGIKARAGFVDVREVCCFTKQHTLSWHQSRDRICGHGGSHDVRG